MRAWSLTLLLFAFAAVGCAPNLGTLNRHLDEDDWSAALAAAGEDEDMQDHLAALILERAARSHPERASQMVGYLRASGKPGKLALERMAEKRGKVADLAFIAAEGSSTPSDEDTERLLSASQPESDVRAAAACAWSRDLEKEVLLPLLEDMDPRVRRCAVDGAALLSPKETAPLLNELVRVDPDPMVRAAAASKGKALGEDGVAVLRDALQDESMGVRHGAIRGLGDIGSREALALIEDLAAGPLVPTSVVAAAQLAAHRTPGGVDRFMDCFDSPRPTVRAAALVHLSTAKIEDADRIRLRMLKDDAFQVVITAAGALMGREEYVDDVISALKGLAERDHPRSPEALGMAAALGDDESLKQVREELEGKDLARISLFLRVAAKASSLRKTFLSLMASKDEEIRIGAARAVLS